MLIVSGMRGMAPGTACQRTHPPSHHAVPRLHHRRARSMSVSVHANLLDTIVKPITTAGKLPELNKGIATFYDESSGLWENMWGEHMHHGYYPKEGSVKSHQQAQLDMIEETLKFAGVNSVHQMVDVGCGIGGSSRYILSKYPGSTSQGITLSPVQAARANTISKAQGLGERANFQVADALQQPFSDGSFDLVWSMESGEHMPDKRKFVNELTRVCAPDGTVIIVTWCHRVLATGESSLKPDELALLDRICEAYYLPAWCSVADYEKLMIEAGLRDIKYADWSEEVSPFWGAVIQMALTSGGIMGLLQAGWTTIKGALVMPLMAQGFRMGLIKFNIITARKPAK